MFRKRLLAVLALLQLQILLLPPPPGLPHQLVYPPPTPTMRRSVYQVS